jgi:hypothetical protein
MTFYVSAFIDQRPPESERPCYARGGQGHGGLLEDIKSLPGRAVPSSHAHESLPISFGLSANNQQ